LTGANPVDRGKPGSKYHLLIDATGVPLAVELSAANTYDSQLLEEVVDAVPAVIGPRGRPGRPRRRPAKLHGGKGYDYPSCRRMLRRRGISPRIARRGVESSSRLGRHRWKVERSLAWLLANRRLTVRYERRADLLTAFLHLACAVLRRQAPTAVKPARRASAGGGHRDTAGHVNRPAPVAGTLRSSACPRPWQQRVSPSAR
jgi:transposase